MTRAALYLRVSLDATGEYLAVDRQRVECISIAEHRGWEIVGEFVDNSISASDARKQRPGYDALTKAYEAGQFDALICWDLDRLTRQPRQMEDWIDAAEGRGLAIVTANGEADLTTDGGRMYARIKLAVARGEIERKSARQRAARRQAALSGRSFSAKRAFGYTESSEVVQSEATIVQQVFARLLAGNSIYAITSWLNETGVQTRSGNPWHESTVRGILTNPRYAGQVKHQGSILDGVKGDWEPLVDEPSFALVQATLADPGRRTATHTHRTRLGSGLFLCGECGSTVRGFSAKAYRCRRGCMSRTSAPIDEFVTEVIVARLERDDLAELIRGADHDTARLQGEATRLRTRMHAIAADYDSGLIDGARYSAATERVRRELEPIERQIDAGSLGGLRSILSADDPAATFRSESIGVRQATIDAVAVVTLHRSARHVHGFNPDSITIDWRAK